MKIESRVQKYQDFLDYLHQGLLINSLFCVDYTLSNDHQSRPSSLHFINPHQFNDNQYTLCIRNILEVILPYDSSKRIPVFGYGAVIQGQAEVSHFFPVNMNPENPELSNINEVIQSYLNSFNHLQLSGPTYFGPLLQNVCRMTEVNVQRNPKNYTILVILTDGMIHDLIETKNWVVQSSHLPLSIIIIGVGDADFGDMEFLDADSTRLRDSAGREQLRDNVQFVEFRKYGSNR